MCACNLPRSVIASLVLMIAVLGRGLAAHAQGAAYLVKDINPASHGASDPSFLTNVDGTLFFAADDGIHESALWRSDGTALGTTLVRDIHFENAGGSPSKLTNVNGVLFFAADNGSGGRALWKSDGTEARTVVVKDMPSPDNSDPANLTDVNGTLFFTTVDSGSGFELWRSDGTAAGTVAVTDINPGYPERFTAAGTRLFFRSGLGLWSSDGTAAGTMPIGDIDSPVLQNVNGTLFFVRGDAALWRSDGTAAGTLAVKDFSVPGGLVEVRDMASMNGTLFFSVLFYYDTEPPTLQLWRSNGTAAGTSLFGQFPAMSQTIPHLTAVKGMLYFIAEDDALFYRLWRSDGNGQGLPIQSFGVFTPDNLIGVKDLLFFNFFDGQTQHLWRSDGTESGTVPLQDIAPGVPSRASVLTVAGSNVFFAADDGTHGTELWAIPLAATQAGTFTVNSTAGAADMLPGDGVCATADGVCTLPAAIGEANALPGGSTINVPAGTYPGGLLIDVDLSLRGAGAGSTRIASGGPVLQVSSGARVDIHDVTIQNGSGDGGYVGGIVNRGEIALTNVTITGNSSESGGSVPLYGGGMVNLGQATLTNVTISDNTLVPHFGLPSEGGGIYNSGSATLTNVTVSGNMAQSEEGGGGGIYNSGTLTATNSTISGNAAADDDLNKDGRGGGIYNDGGTLTLTNSTVSANTAVDFGGGIYTNTFGGAVQLKDTIVANPGANCAGAAIVSLGHNLDSGFTCGFTAAGDLSNTDPKLGPLQDNGGPTFTQALLPGSPAIGAGSPDCPPPATDQRGVPRTSPCDIGAYAAAATPPNTTPTPSETATASPSPTAPSTSTWTSTPTGTATHSATPIATATPSPARTATALPTASATPISSASATPTSTATGKATPAACVGDCGGSGVVTIADLITGVNIVLGDLPVSACAHFANAHGTVDIAQLIHGVSNALNGCASAQ